MKESAARHVTEPRDTGFRAGLASCLVHAVFFSLLLGTSALYQQHLLRFPPINLSEPPTMVLKLTPIVVPPPVIVPPAPSSPVPAPPPAIAHPVAPVTPAVHHATKTKPSTHSREGEVTHHTHKHPPHVIPQLTQPPVARAVPPKNPPRALPLLPPAPIIHTVVPKTPHLLPPGPVPVIAPPVKPKPSHRAEVVKPIPVATPVYDLPPMPPPKALPVIPAPEPVAPAPKPVYNLPPMPPPKALPVAPEPTPVYNLPPMPPPKAMPVAPPPEVAAAVPPAAPSPPAPPPTTDAPPSLDTGGAEVRGPDGTSFPQPNYPYSARSRGLSGTVVMTVQFDAKGGVVFADVAQSSGASILDESTRSFILRKWHLPNHAGQTVSVSVIYDLKKISQ